MELQTEQATLETSTHDSETPRTLDNNCLTLYPSDINHAARVSKATMTGQDVRRRHQRILTTNRSLQKQQRSHERHDFARYGTTWFDMRLHGKRLWWQSDSNNQHDHHPHDNDNQTNNIWTSYSRNERLRPPQSDGDDENDDDGTLLILFQLIECCSSTAEQLQPTNRQCYAYPAPDTGSRDGADNESLSRVPVNHADLNTCLAEWHPAKSGAI